MIAIIAVLASLVTAAAIRALNAAKRNRIVLDIKNISTSLENFKNDYGAYPPNCMNLGNNPTLGLASSDMVRMFKKAFPRINQQEMDVVEALAGQNMSGSNVVTSDQLQGGMSASEALVFWLGGFSDDPQFPLSGAGGPSFADFNKPGDEILEDRKRRYEFEVSQYAPRNADGMFDENDKRYVEYQIDLNGNGKTNDEGETRQINLWQFRPSGSEQPLVYFDVSRYKPNKYDPPAEPGVVDNVLAIKKVREGMTEPREITDIAFVNTGKFQIIHCGLDDAWGDFGPSVSGSAALNDLLPYLYPTGPYVGDTADTLTNFFDGELSDAAEE